MRFLPRAVLATTTLVLAASPALADTQFGGTSGVLSIGGKRGNITVLPPSALPPPTATSAGGVMAGSAPAHQFQTGIGTNGAPLFGQPQVVDIVGALNKAGDATPNSIVAWPLTAAITDAFRFAINGYPTSAEFGGGTVPISAALVGANDIPATATANNASFGVAGYARTASSTSAHGAVGLFGFGGWSGQGSGSNGSMTAWGLNTVSTNCPDPNCIGNGGFGFNNGTVWGYELDVNIAPVQTGNTTVNVRGLDIVGGSNITQAQFNAGGGYAIGYILNSWGHQQSPPLKWTHGFYSFDGVSSDFLSAGTSDVGNNVGSQPIVLRSRTSAGTNNTSSISADAFGNIVHATPAGSGSAFVDATGLNPLTIYPSTVTLGHANTTTSSGSVPLTFSTIVSGTATTATIQADPFANLMTTVGGNASFTVQDNSGKQLFAASPSLFNLKQPISNTPLVASTPTADSAQDTTQNSPVLASGIYGPITASGLFYTEAKRVAVVVPAGSKAVNTSGYGCYLRDDNPLSTDTGTGETLGAGVCGFNIALANANGAVVWGGATYLSDSATNAAVSGATGRGVVGHEYDAFGYQGNSSFSGINILPGGTWAYATGFRIDSRGAQNVNEGFTVGDGTIKAGAWATVTGIAGVAAGATPIGGQVHRDDWWDGTARRSWTYATQADGGYIFVPTVAGKPFRIQAPVFVTGNTTATQHFISSTTIQQPAACGTSPSATGTDHGGNFVVGTGTVTSCTISYGTPWPNAAYPTLTPTSNLAGATYYISAQSKNGFVVTFSASVPSASFNYTVQGS